MKSKQHIHIGIEDADRGFDGFVGAWHTAETGEIEQVEIHLNFEDFAMLSSLPLLAMTLFRSIYA
jgi:hypothetical protein